MKQPTIPQTQPVSVFELSSAQLYDAESGYIETSDGEHFRLENPICHVDVIAHALALNCRYNGHCRQFYSVAEHSVLVAELMAKRGQANPFEGLMHDASEAYLTDVPAPFKYAMPDTCKIDKNLDAAIRAQFGLPPEMTEECRICDVLALWIEAYYLMPSKGADWYDPWNLRDEALKLRIKYEPMLFGPEMSESLFNTAYSKYCVGNTLALNKLHEREARKWAKLSVSA